MNGLIQRLDAEVSLQRVRDAPSQHLSGEPVHDRHEVKEAAPHRQVGDVGTPDLAGAIDLQPAQQIGIGLVPLPRLAGVGLLVDRHQAHEPHKAPDALLVHAVPLVLQMPSHLPDPVEGGVEELLVDKLHQAEVLLRLSDRFMIEGRARDRQQAALRTDRQRRMAPLNHPSPHLPVHGLSFRDKKSLATASSPILACSDRTVSSFTSATGFLPPRSKISAAPSSSAFFH